MTTKHCKRCDQRKPYDEFWRDRSRPDGFGYLCRSCGAARDRERMARAGERERKAAEKLARRHGLTPAEREQRYEGQGGRCGCCGDPMPLEGMHIDHAHSCCPGRREQACGRCTRALLCPPCNLGLGHFHDDPRRLLAAVDYLRRWAQEPQSAPSQSPAAQP